MAKFSQDALNAANPKNQLQETMVSVRGENAISNLFQSLKFPATRSEVLTYCIGYELQWTDREPIMVEDVVSEFPTEVVFSDAADLTNSICSSIRLAFGDHSVTNEAPILKSPTRK